jgi:hypothetical protein
MSKVNAILGKRLGKKKGGGARKMAKLATESASGRLSSFAGVFSVSELSDAERAQLEELLLTYSEEGDDVGADLNQLMSITSEVKAITNQAAILHGERIKRAQDILTRYRDGAFSAWLVTTYGNRQTPYNFLQYYTFYTSMPKTLRPQIERMPRQAIYSLASREGDTDKKRGLVEDYNGESKAELLTLIRDMFPLDKDDGRRQNKGELAITALNKLYSTLHTGKLGLTKSQKRSISELLDRLRTLT